ncbi:helix-turn-helix transcriptional regulator [Sinorhizobium sp. BG8]|uniref:helix-turn-helix transcriptional regulator n=1 Tax=Sinorhizobium sp. BG8 TaxID=2613773 RepID=UPI00193E44F5|nr:helix-turn-helix transcriptional regulator [Sinorhizobium sp. BG8]QRM56038.1 helix-turn-helix transcriptional regulator [Sinorhizobium sp. BG8]
MRVDFAPLFSAITEMVDLQAATDAGGVFLRMMQSVVRFDDVVVFAYRDKERPLDLFSTFDAGDHEVFVSLYQAGPYLLDPFYHTARQGREGLFRMRELAPDRFFSSEYFRSYYSQTRLSEEVGFFVPLDGGITVVLSLMRREGTGVFPAGEFAMLGYAQPLVSAFARRAWPNLGAQFDGTLGGGARGRRAEPASAADRVWRKLNLTEREAGIIELVLQGHSSESIGLRLGISTGTVKVHRRNVYRKLGISSQIQLLSIYLQNLER